MIKKIAYIVTAICVCVIICSCKKKLDNNDNTSTITSVEQTVTGIGGVVSLNAVADVTIDEATFDKTTKVILSKTNDPITDEDFDFTKGLFGIQNTIDYEIRINTGDEMPLKSMKVLVHVPEDFATNVNTDFGLQVFGQLYYQDENEALDNFEIIESKYSASAQTLEIKLPAYYFTNVRNTTKSFEAILKIATCSGPNLSVGKSTGDDKDGQFISCPTSSCTITSDFGPRKHPITHELNGFHSGTDFEASVGTPVLAATDGIVKEIRYQFSQQKGTGWGHFIRIEHTSGDKVYSTLYAHLSKTDISLNTHVTEGQVIGLSGESGGVTRPHLHFEYFIGSDLNDKSARVNPAKLIDTESPRLLSGVAKCLAVNDCNGKHGLGSSWNIVFNYKDPKNSITPDATLTFQDVEPYVNPSFSVQVGSLQANGGQVGSSVFCATFTESDYLKAKVYMTLANGKKTNAIYFVLKRPAGANKQNYATPQSNSLDRPGMINL
jgi:murein DD-endopeptidase MepM/ murein hydrolase activator NlpD